MQKQLQINTERLDDVIRDDDRLKIMPEVEKAHRKLKDQKEGNGGSLGWMNPEKIISNGTLDDIEKTAKRLMSISDVVIIVGIGGSYLGAKAVIDAVAPKEGKGKVVFAGYNIAGDYISELFNFLEGKDISINVVSKSGTTTEPAIAFRVIEDILKKKYGADNIADRIICTTDKKSGALRTIAEEKGYKSFVIPADIGGRFSVLTPVGLFPAACAGVDIKELIAGALNQKERSDKSSLEENPSYIYAALRNILYTKGKKIEILSNFDHRLHYMSEWWKQLFGESEGKAFHSIFPASCDFSTDLHSMGQLIQEGERNLFETFLIVEKEEKHIVIPGSDNNLDNLDYLVGKEMSYVNRKAYEATSEAHYEGGVPNSTIFMPERSAFYLGELFYFFELAVSVSAYISGVNPFDQPGVEAYKLKMFKFLGRPG